MEKAKAGKETNVYTAQCRLATTALLSDVPTFCALTVSAISTGSLVVWMDFLDCLCCELHQLFIVLLSRWLRRDLRYTYNYGVGKIEAVASVCCDFLLFFSVLSIIIFSVKELFDPQQPSGFLIAVVGLKVINVLVDVYFYIKQQKVYKRTHNHVMESELANAKKDLWFDAATLVCIFISFAVRNFRPGWYISPVVCIVIGLLIMKEAVLRLKNAVSEILDKTADEDTQYQILKILSSTYDQYEEFEAVKTHSSSGVLYIDLSLRFAQGTTFSEIEDYQRRFQKEIRESIENAVVTIVISTGKQATAAIQETAGTH